MNVLNWFQLHIEDKALPELHTLWYCAVPFITNSLFLLFIAGVCTSNAQHLHASTPVHLAFESELEL